MVQILNEALAAINRLIEGASLRQRGFDKDSAEWHSIAVELEAYGRAVDVLLQLSEKRGPEFELLDRDCQWLKPVLLGSCRIFSASVCVQPES